MLAFTFPGQGSQRPGMGQPWVDHPSWELVADASEVCERDLARLLLDADQTELNRTEHSQLAMFTLSLVILDAIERVGIEPTHAAGHSMGEYSALVASGAVSVEEGLLLVSQRGEAMQEAADERPGTMAAILGLDDDSVSAACRRADSDVWVANYNAPGQVVIAGVPDAVEEAARIALGMGARKIVLLEVGGAFHTQMMSPARAGLRKALAEVNFHVPEMMVVANVDARPHDDPEEWPSLLSAQLWSPVRWRQTLEYLHGCGIRKVVEVGPGGVLSGIARRTLPDCQSMSVATPGDLDLLVDALAGQGPLHAYAIEHPGEQLYVSERLVVSPCSGLLVLAGGAAGEADDIAAGDLLGTVAGQDVRSPFTGRLMGMLAVDGERVTPGQPIAWLRSA